MHLEDLVLHDAGMDVSAPTHALIRAHAVLRARRRIAAEPADWALSGAGLAALRGDAAGGAGPEQGRGRTAQSDAMGGGARATIPTATASTTARLATTARARRTVSIPNLRRSTL